MNNPELESLLKKARLPEISGESLEMFPRRLVARLKHHEAPARSARNFSPRMAWAFGLAAGFVLAFAMIHWCGQFKTVPSPDALADIKVVQKTLAMFPNEVRAIAEDEHGLNLELSENADVPVSPPLYIHICNGKHCSSFVTFSGQEIQFAGQKVTVLADARGGIILAGDEFVWSNTEQSDARNHLKIEAKNLGVMAM
jgi:hypothetical protein